MALRLFARSCLTPEQLEAIEDAGVEAEVVVNPACRLVNTCGREAADLLADSTLPLYDPGKGVYGKWGDIPLTWNNESLDPSWQVALYRDQYGYRVGDKVIFVSRDGYTLIVYEASENTPSPPGAFDLELWTEVCRVDTPEPLGLPTYQELISLYGYYEPRKYLTEWGNFESSWNNDLVGSNSDKWNSAKVEKDFFYVTGDTVLYDSVCGNFTCAYIAVSNMPFDSSLVVPGPPSTLYWRKLYCIENGKPDKCVKSVECENLPNRKVVNLSNTSDDSICVPVESYTGTGR